MASAETSKIQSKLSALSTSLDEIESILEPLLSGSLAESIINLEPLQQAKLQTVLPYAVYDLVFMYLKLEGVDPKTHPVIGELGRIKEYFDKISNTENPPQRRVEIDQAAAGRFIKAAITQAKWRKTAAEEKEEDEQGDSDEPEASTSVSKPTAAERVPVKVTTKMLERQRYEEELKRAGAEGEEEEGLEVFDEEEENEGGEKGEDEEADGQAMHVDEPAKEQAGSKKKRARPVLDPFQGYGDEMETTKATKAPSPAVTPSQSTLAESSESPKKKKKKSSAASTSGSKKKKAK